MAIINIPKLIPSQIAWANRPSAANNYGMVIEVSNIGTNGSYWVSNGTRWMPMNGDITLANVNSTYSHTGTVAETTLATVTIPGGVMGTSSRIEVIALFTTTNSANTKTIKVKFGGTSYYSVNSTTINAVTTVTNICNNKSTSSQIGSGGNSSAGIGSATVAAATSSVDTTQDVALTFTGTLANSGENISLLGYTVILRA